MNKSILLTLLIIATFNFVTAQSDSILTVQTVSINTIKSHLNFLTSDLLRGRNAPSPELKIAAEYIKSRFLEYGIDKPEGMSDYFQEVPLETIHPAQQATIQYDTVTLRYPDDFLLLNPDNGNTTGKTVFIGYGTKADFQASDVVGKVVVTLCGDGENEGVMNYYQYARTKRDYAQEAGALALIEIYGSATTPYPVLKRFFGPRKQTRLKAINEEEAYLPHMWINAIDTSATQLLKTAEQRISIDIKGLKKELAYSQNVVGFTEGTDPILKNEIVIYSAHYDHLGVGNPNAEGDSIYNGARDNAIGTTTVLSVAENFGKFPTKRSALYILFTAEEKGLLGSEWFVENSPVELSNVVFCFNSDNGGYNDTTRASIIGLTRTTSESLIREACSAFGLQAMEDSAPEQGLFDRSDNVNFAKKGIPAPTFSLGFTRFDAEIYKYYHQPGDHAESLNYEYLDKFFKAYVLSSRMIANSENKPFWKEGDKYYDAGVKLYEND